MPQALRARNAFSKKFHVHMGGALTGVYNWLRVHKTLRGTPAMKAGLMDRLWSMEEIAELIEAAAPKPGRSAT